MAKGKINVSVENIFPLIKKFLYSDHEIFLRELISNATDATLKLKHLSNIGEFKDDYGDPIIEVKIDKKNIRLHIIDQGIGMTGDEIKKYINEVAFSGAEEFLEKYKDSAKDSGIIGHFGLGFYSAFMVSDSVEIISKSHKKDPAVHWKCDGSPEYSLTNAKKTDRGTEIILNISKDSKSFLEENTIRELLKKYNRFMPVPIKFGQKEISKKVGEGKDEEEIKETSNELFIIFALALLTAYLVMAATFNSFIHPFIIVLTVPLAIFGGLVFILFLNSSVNIFSQIALIILIGISTKNSILIVDYANRIRTTGKSIELAVKEACAVRFRPIIMTSLSTMIAMIPLVIGNIGPGAGEGSRLAVGATILGGMIISTFFTLYVTPSMYLALAKNTKRIDVIDLELKKELSKK